MDKMNVMKTNACDNGKLKEREKFTDDMTVIEIRWCDECDEDKLIHMNVVETRKVGGRRRLAGRQHRQEPYIVMWGNTRSLHTDVGETLCFGIRENHLVFFWQLDYQLKLQRHFCPQTSRRVDRPAAQKPRKTPETSAHSVAWQSELCLATAAHSVETVKAGSRRCRTSGASTSCKQPRCELQHEIWERPLNSWSASLSRSARHDKTSSGRGRHSLRLRSSVSTRRNVAWRVFASGTSTFVCRRARGSSTAMQAANAIERWKPHRSSKQLFPGMAGEVRLDVLFKRGKPAMLSRVSVVPALARWSALAAKKTMKSMNLNQHANRCSWSLRSKPCQLLTWGWQKAFATLKLNA